MTVLDEQVSLAAPGSSGTITPFGAQVMSWSPEEESPVLWVSRHAVLDGSAPVRGGIPICLPWFGTGIDGSRRPAHGFARTARWTRLDGGDSSPDAPVSSVAFRLDHDAVDATRAELTEPVPPSSLSAGTHAPSSPFPHRFHAVVRVALTDDLVISLTVTNDDDHPITVENALHTYLAVGDVKDVTIEGLEGTDYLDVSRGDGKWRTQVGELALVAPTDRIYRSASPLVLRDPRLRRAVTIDKDGSASTIVWNPWAEAAGGLADIGAHDWQEFVCVEVGNVRDDALHLAPGESQDLVLVLHVDPMA